MKLVIAALMGLSLAQDLDSSNVTGAPTFGVQIVEEENEVKGAEVATQTEVE